MTIEMFILVAISLLSLRLTSLASKQVDAAIVATERLKSQSQQSAQTTTPDPQKIPAPVEVKQGQLSRTRSEFCAVGLEECRPQRYLQNSHGGITYYRIF